MRQISIPASASRTVILGAALVGAVGLSVAGCSNQPAAIPIAVTQPAVDLDAVRPQVNRFCGGCHAVPLPDSFPKDRWAHEVERGYEFYLLSGRTDLVLPRRSDVTEYYSTLAPERLAFPAEIRRQEPHRFVRSEITWPADLGKGLAVSHILALPGSSASPDAQLVVCDMQIGTVTWISMAAEQARLRAQLRLGHPDHLCQTDLDGDGQPDYLVCDLGSFLPEDHSRGRVVWLRPREGGDGQTLDEIVLLDQVGRVADAQAADFDGDGDLDIIVAVFGWHTTGSLVLLRQQAADGGRPQFESTVIDPRPGAIHVPVADLNGDDRPDFVVVFSQEHESVEAFISQVDGTFDKQVLYRAPDPSYGSTGIQLVDLDRDGDQDVLYTNGDTFDSYLVKPYHRIRWIENRGDASWQDHPLTNMPGVTRALAGDLDGDGDLDIAACAFVPAQAIDRQPEVASFASLVWLEQQTGKFIRHEIESNYCVHAVLELADLNHDGALDLAVGNFGQSAADQLPPFAVWLNQAPRPSPASDSQDAPVPATRSEAAAD